MSHLSGALPQKNALKKGRQFFAHSAGSTSPVSAIVPTRRNEAGVIVNSTAPSTKRAYRFLDFCKTYQVGKDRAYADIRSGALIARKVGKNTIILVDDAEAYIASLPRLELPPEYSLLDVRVDDLPVCPPDLIERFESVLAQWVPPPREYRPKTNGARPPTSPNRMRLYAEAALVGERQALASMPADSGRNPALFRAGCKLGKYVHHRVLSIAELESALLQEACQANGLIKEDGLQACKATLASGLHKAEGDDLPVLEDRNKPASCDAQAEHAASEAAATAQKDRGNGQDANAEFMATSGDDARTGDAKKEGDQEQEATDPHLLEMNGKYAVVRVGGKTRVVCLEDNLTYPGCKVPVYSSISDFCSFHAKRRKVFVDEKGEERKIGIGHWWIKHEQRRQYDGIVYAPGADAKATHGKLNLWTGFSCAPVEGNCALYLAHLRDNICSGVEAHFQYLLNWMAYSVQHPDRPGEVAVVMRGKEGVGKGVAAREFGRLLGSHFRGQPHIRRWLSIALPPSPASQRSSHRVNRPGSSRATPDAQVDASSTYAR
jgi:hypothetical protein